MKTKFVLKLGAACLLAIAMCGAATQSAAQTTNKPAPSKKSATDTPESSKGEKKPAAGPFHGKLASVDQTAKTISVGKRTFLITSETKIKKEGKPATLQDGVVGEEVSGYVKPNDAGKLVATTVNFGPKPKTSENKSSGSTEKQEKQAK